MGSDIKRCALVVCAILTAACSSAPRTAEPAAATAAAGAPSSDVDLSIVKAGYSVLRRHDQVFYCRNEIITGNRIGTRVCLTAAQIQDEKHDLTKAKDLMNQPSTRCLGASCNN
jgi:hypothetical protein